MVLRHDATIPSPDTWLASAPCVSPCALLVLMATLFWRGCANDRKRLSLSACHSPLSFYMLVTLCLSLSILGKSHDVMYRWIPRATDCTSVPPVTQDPPITQGTALDEEREDLPVARKLVLQRGTEKRNREEEVSETQQSTRGSNSAAAVLDRAVQEALARQAVIHQAQICELHIMFQELQITRDRYSMSMGSDKELLARKVDVKGEGRVWESLENREGKTRLLFLESN